MGGLSQPVRRSNEVNWLNPASYGALLQTTIEAGVCGSQGTIANASQSNNVNNAFMAYINFAMPISVKRGIGFSFGVAPYTGVGYNVTSTSTNHFDTSSTFDATSYFQGRGGISRAYLGIGFRLTKNLSLGGNLVYAFGQVNSTTQFIIPPEYNMFNWVQEKRDYISGFMFDAGLQFHHDSIFVRTLPASRRNNKRIYGLNVGLTGSPTADLDVTRFYTLRTLPIGLTFGLKDTISHSDNVSGTLVLPMSAKAGIGITSRGDKDKNNWFVGADVSYTTWSQFRNFGLSDSLRDNLGFHFGASFIPDGDDFKHVLNRIEYRVGGRYEQGNVVFNGTPIDLYGMSAGLSIPINKTRKEAPSRVNVTVEYLQRGTLRSGLIREDYFRVIIGITFCQKWFVHYGLQ
jgi:hypothetical protein